MILMEQLMVLFHCKVGGGKNGWEHHLKVQERPNLPLFSGMMSLIDANIYRTMTYFFPQAHSTTTHIQMRQMLVKALLMNPLTIVLPEKKIYLNLLSTDQHF